MSLSSILDTALDRSVALGYGNVGLAVRRRLPEWPADPPRMDGRIVLITGAASGLGQAAAQGFARLGAGVRVLGRDQRRAEDARAGVLEAVPGAEVQAVACDLSSLAAIRSFARRFSADEERLDVLVNNAGVMPDERSRSADGHELMFATHVLAPFALTSLLADLLARSAPARVINVSSGGMYGQAIPEGDLQSEQEDYSPKKLYARTKREQVAVTEGWAERLKDRGVVVHSMHPGWVDTEGVRQWMPVFRSATLPIMRNPEQGADTVVWLGAAPEPLRQTGLFWHDRRPRPTSYLIGPSPGGAEERRRLWELCEQATAPAGG